MLWDTVKKSLYGSLPESEFTLWIQPLVCTLESESTMELACPDRFFYAWVKDRYLNTIQSSLAVEKELKVRLTVTDSPAPQVEDNGSGQLRLPGVNRVKSTIRSLHPAYTFEQFMVGESNQLAQSACSAIAGSETTFGNNLFLTSDTGLGKSHLTQAVVHQVQHTAPGTRMHYLTAQQFSAEMVKGIREKKMEQFSRKYVHDCDLLLVEDVHTLVGKTKTQEELNNVLDYLIKAGKRVILTSALSPRKLDGLDEDFRSRMASGLVTDIEVPEFQTRIAIIRHKAAGMKLDDEQVHYLAEKLQGDIRRIESAIIGIRAKACLRSMNPDMALLREVVGGLVEQDRCGQVTAEAIRELVSCKFKVSTEELKSRSRKRAVTFPRQVGMYLARKHTDESLADIGRLYNRDHSTVLYAIKVINRDVAGKEAVRRQVEMVAASLKLD